MSFIGGFTVDEINDSYYSTLLIAYVCSPITTVIAVFAALNSLDENSSIVLTECCLWYENTQFCPHSEIRGETENEWRNGE